MLPSPTDQRQQKIPFSLYRSDVVDTTQVHYVLSAGSISSSSEAKSLLPSTSGMQGFASQGISTPTLN